MYLENLICYNSYAASVEIMKKNVSLCSIVKKDATFLSISLFMFINFDLIKW